MSKNKGAGKKEALSGKRRANPGRKSQSIYKKDGTIDMRHLGPYNVDQGPTGFVSNGAIKNPI